MGDQNSAQGGGLFAKASGVTNEGANEVAKFQGGFTAELVTDTIEWYGQERTRQDAEVVRSDVILTVDEVAFKPGLLATLHGLSVNGADTLKTALAEAATSYSLDSTTVPPELEWLVSMTINGKIFQAFAQSGIALGAPIAFSNRAINVSNLRLLLYAASGNLIKYLIEN